MNKIDQNYDVIVIGGGSAGVIAAIASARSNAKTLLIEENAILGGTNTASLVGPIIPFIGENNQQIVDGIPQEIIDELIKIGGAIGHVEDPIDFAYGLTPVDFRLLQLVQANVAHSTENLDILFDNSVIDVIVEGRKVIGVITQNKFGEHKEFYAHNFIDSSGDADVVTMAKAEVVVGRESDNKSQPMTMCFNLGNVDLNQVRDDVSKKPENFVVNERIAAGERMDYVAISGYFDEVKSSIDFPVERDRLLFFQGVREGEVGVNTTRILDKSNLNEKELVAAEIEGQTQVLRLFKWLRNNIPAFKHSYLKDVGVIGVRESRHLVGRKRLEDNDVLYGNKQEKSVAVGSYPIDVHSPDSAQMEFIEEQIVKNFEIDLEMLMPKNLDNILVAGRPISATHKAHAASRGSATCMAIGQSAGIIAAMSSKNQVLIEKLDYDKVKSEIHKFGGITER